MGTWHGTVPRLWAPKAAQASVRLSDTDKGIAAKAEKDHHIRLLWRRTEETRETEGGKEEQKGGGVEKRKHPQSILKKRGRVFSYPEEGLD